MKEQIEQLKEWIKEQPVRGCITGSSMVEYFEGQDVDVFLYDKSSFTEMFYILKHHPKFQMIDPLEQWKANKFRKNIDDFAKSGILTMKFLYNNCVQINITLKKGAINMYGVLSSFDMNLICVAYDIQTRQPLDLSGDSHKTRIIDWNRHNTAFYEPELWEMARILRQLVRVFKYNKRGFDVDLMVLKYIEIIDEIQNFQNVFNSEEFTESLRIRKENTKLVKEICNRWLETHTITDEEIVLIETKMREI